MERHFETSLKELKQHLISMGGQVERAINIAIEGLQRADRSRFTQLFEIEKEINRAHMYVDEAAVKLLALHQPLAADLRLIVATIKINTDLERMGDQAVNIAHNAEHYIQAPPLKPLIDLPIMFTQARVMVREALDAFIESDAKKAWAVLKRDDELDHLKRKIMQDVVEVMKGRPDAIEQGLSLILIARNLERIGDHATNIAEDVIFAVSGEDIRHPAQGKVAQK